MGWAGWLLPALGNRIFFVALAQEWINIAIFLILGPRGLLFRVIGV